MSTMLNSFQGRFARAELFRAGDPVSAHTHPQLHLVMKVSGADIHYRTESGPVVVGEQTVMLVNPWTAHAREAPTEGEDTTLLCLAVEPSWLGASATGLLEADPPKVVARPDGLADAETLKARDAFARILARSGGASDRDGATRFNQDTELESALDVLLELLVVRSVARHSANGGQEQLPTGQRPIDQRIRRAICLMRERVCKEPGIDAIAVAAGLSRSRFFERFRDCCGVTPRYYADTLMMEEAVRMLTEEDESIANISDTLGFSAQSHFTRFFRHKAGVSPSVYRRATSGFRDRRAANFEGVLEA